MNRILTYGGFIISVLVVMAAFITTTTYIQLAVGIALYPLLVYFGYKIFRRKTQSSSSVNPITAIQPPAETLDVKTAERENIGIADIDKRVFLKLIGGAGLSIFLFSILSKKAEGLFFKGLPTQGRVSLEDIGGNKIDPAQNQPMDGYRISEIDDNVITFYGFINKDGAWIVMKEDTDTGSFRYTKGDSNFSGSWTNRENLKYDYFSDIF